MLDWESFAVDGDTIPGVRAWRLGSLPPRPSPWEGVCLNRFTACFGYICEVIRGPLALGFNGIHRGPGRCSECSMPTCRQGLWMVGRSARHQRSDLRGEIAGRSRCSSALSVGGIFLSRAGCYRAVGGGRSLTGCLRRLWQRTQP